MILLVVGFTQRSQMNFTPIFAWTGLIFAIMFLSMVFKVGRYVHKVEITDDSLALSSAGRRCTLTPQEILRLNVHMDYQNPFLRVVDRNGKRWTIALFAFSNAQILANNIQEWWSRHREPTSIKNGETQTFYHRSVGYLFLAIGVIGLLVGLVIFFLDHYALKEGMTVAVLTSPMWFLSRLFFSKHIEVSEDGVLFTSLGKQTKIEWQEVKAFTISNAGNPSVENSFISWRNKDFSVGMVDDCEELRDLLLRHLTPQQIVDRRRSPF